MAMLALVDCISCDAILAIWDTPSSDTISSLSSLSSKLTDCDASFVALYTAMKSLLGSDLAMYKKWFMPTILSDPITI
jgi:hypothetical protein